ncbi:PREDICTED: tumor necrosis factor ligand superfamily member 10-like [Branchiostoma belcheri]|uniref:Tumor necrosis factor ligand superfamily member 10-like n=1 Tax=Branchiostoma belcheri TaxID=7741 RepID=A0A6P5AFB1_BRABE|nr:PREDICTED: tumor necrosis factor ligand superfamily member 10-like [Branchiostoma belcheri]
MGGPDPYSSLRQTDLTDLKTKLSVLHAAVVLLVVLVVGLLLALVCVTVFLTERIQDAQDVAEELGLPGVSVLKGVPGRGKTSVVEYVTGIIEQVLGNRTSDEKDKEDTGDFLLQGPFYKKDGEGEHTFLAKPMAHLTGSTLDRPRSLDHVHSNHSTLRVTYWESNQGLATLANGMKYRDGYIKVPVDGMYYVYSQLYFRYMRDNREPRPSDNHQLLHYTYKKSATYRDKQEVMKSARTK